MIILDRSMEEQLAANLLFLQHFGASTPPYPRELDDESAQKIIIPGFGA